VTRFFSFISITMRRSFDPFTLAHTHPSLEKRHHLQAQIMLKNTAAA